MKSVQANGHTHDYACSTQQVYVKLEAVYENSDVKLLCSMSLDP